ncbi:hypothetical protein DVH24_010257 [Malus domestica]|uniref:Uncharacterized protein n=1 Tax=Malus domestica TaxID=3750 RepID=A0A498JWR5_MALDO|nr:hypothetical protein DVH24_010257 [Malus domestica]
MWTGIGDDYKTGYDDYPKECNTQDGREVMSSSSTTSVHVTALDGLVNVNSLFTIAVFVGLSLATPGQRSLENRTSCDAGIDVAKKLLVFEVVSFSFFLFSSLVAQGLKLAINLLNSKNVEDAFRGHINTKVLRLGMLGEMGCRRVVAAQERSDDYPRESNTRDCREVMSSSSTTSVHVTALDGLVNVNSLFTIAVFVGLSLATPGQKSLANRISCDAGNDVAKKLLVFEVVSFSFFLFSSLVAQGLKLAINLLNSKNVEDAFRGHINLKVLRFGMLGSAFGSVLGCVFLVLSMVNVIQIKLGLLSCGSKSAIHAVAVLVVLVTSALLVYISTAVYAFLH